mmetsp:Transcript_9838/g.18291  ORF Transcript_9838/g.18291 Transcript_9838/m.18291 type:complete len:209 (-) Transcript_9838:125-751(-)
MPKYCPGILIVLELQKFHFRNRPHQRTCHIPQDSHFGFVVLFRGVDASVGHRFGERVDASHAVFFWVVVGHIGGVGDAGDGGVIGKATGNGTGDVKGSGVPSLVLVALLIFAQNLPIRQSNLDIHRNFFTQFLVPSLLYIIINIRPNLNPRRVHLPLQKALSSNQIGSGVVHARPGGRLGTAALQAGFIFLVSRLSDIFFEISELFFE